MTRPQLTAAISTVEAKISTLPANSRERHGLVAYLRTLRTERLGFEVRAAKRAGVAA